jgi:hypothetical protein
MYSLEIYIVVVQNLGEFRWDMRLLYSYKLCLKFVCFVHVTFALLLCNISGNSVVVALCYKAYNDLENIQFDK